MAIEQSDVYERLVGVGIRFVSFRPRSEKEIRDFLLKKLTTSHTIAPIIFDHVIERLRELGYVDDKKFAAWWIEQRTGRKPKGKKFIERELQQKGITADVAIDEKTLARRAVEKKRVLWKSLPYLVKKKKLSDFLYRQGFDWETISGIMSEANEKD